MVRSVRSGLVMGQRRWRRVPVAAAAGGAALAEVPARHRVEELRRLTRARIVTPLSSRSSRILRAPSPPLRPASSRLVALRGLGVGPVGEDLLDLGSPETIAIIINIIIIINSF